MNWSRRNDCVMAYTLANPYAVAWDWLDDSEQLFLRNDIIWC